MSSDNSSLARGPLYGHQLCDGWTNNTEGAIYHLGNTILLLGYMGGSGPYGCLFIFGFMVPSFLCMQLWGWLTVCGLDVFTWNLLLMLACLAQICHLIYRLRKQGLPSEELRSLYRAVYLPLGVPVQVFQEVSGAFDNRVLELKAGDTYALEGKTPIDQLSFLLSGRMCVSLEGQFLHYIQGHQFLDSPEWESLQPNEQGNFQVTLTAEEDCRYVSWRRRRLYTLLSRERYVARLFSVMLGFDIAEKLYTLNNKLFVKNGMRLDIRLPSLYHVLLALPAAGASRSSEDSGGGNAARDQRGSSDGPDQRRWDSLGDDPKPDYQNSQNDRKQDPGTTSARDDPRDYEPEPWDSDTAFPPGEDSGSLALEDFADVAGSLMDYGSERDYLR
ncbi:hypothetical protein NHX12_007852 [Muraenolepis orangiensis]|uniref:POPDC1-3 domain-containing protein n=1 Tax=Muraenolepis orangiensis TaxID=630683 RepID=A0A9Q0DPY0_9TELE|nr:hypothetical protein NHX12_007852 [Muraenolepis orangiensis]